MGNILILKSVWSESRAKLDAFRRPCQIVIQDFCRSRSTDSVIRLVVEQWPEEYRVMRLSYQAKRFGDDIKQTCCITTTQRVDAFDKLEELATCLELEHYHLLEEWEQDIVAVHEHAIEHCSLDIECMGVSAFQSRYSRDTMCQVKSLPRGYLCLLTVDAYGCARVINSAGDVGDAPMSLRSTYTAMIERAGDKGFVAEGIFDGARFFVTDVLYCKDRWLEDTPQKYSLLYDNKRPIPGQLSTHHVAVNALDALFHGKIGALMVYTRHGRFIVGPDEPTVVSVSGEQKRALYDEKLRRLGTLKEPACFDLSYRSFKCLSLCTSHLGLDGVFV